MAGEKRRLTPLKAGYAWDAEIPPAVGSEPPDGEATATTTDRQERTAGSGGSPTAGQTERWRARTFDVAARVAALEEAVVRAMRPGLSNPNARAWRHLRRIGGGFAAVRDSLYEATSAAERCPLATAGAPYALYVEAALWWYADLLRDVQRAAGAGEALDGVADASAEYSVARVLPLYAAIAEAAPEPALAALQSACLSLHEDVLWLEWHLKER